MSSVAEPPDLEAAEPTTAVEVPFWQKYNAHFEFPSSVVLAVLSFVMLFAVIVGVLLLALSGGRDAKPVPIRMVQGSDDSGDGSQGSGGQETLLAKGDPLPQAAEQLTLPNTTTPLPDVKDPTPAPVIPDPTAPGKLADPNQTEFQKLVDELRNPKTTGGPVGSGLEKGTGNTGQRGPGPGGTGNDNTHKRSLRWSLRFKTENGRDYVKQLAAMKATVVMPQPPDEKDAFVYRDLNNPKQGEKLAEGEWTRLATQIQFIDTLASSVKGVAEALGVGFTPRRFLAFFPPELEAELARMETKYRNRRAEDIEETVFRVTVRGGAYTLEVESQTGKR